MSRSILLKPYVTGLVQAACNESQAGATLHEIETIRREAIAECEKKLQADLDADRKKQDKLWQVLEAGVTKFQEELEQIINDQMIEMAVRIAEIIIRSSLPDRDMVRDVIRETLEPLPDLHGIRVRMSPDDAKDIVASRERDDSREVSDIVEVVSDTSLALGDVMIESRNGYFNAQITERLEILKQRLKERYKNAHADKT